MIFFLNIYNGSRAAVSPHNADEYCPVISALERSQSMRIIDREKIQSLNRK